MKDLLDSWTMPHANNSLPIHPLIPEGFLPFPNLKRILFLPLEVYLPFAHHVKLAGVVYRERLEDE